MSIFEANLLNINLDLDFGSQTKKWKEILDRLKQLSEKHVELVNNVLEAVVRDNHIRRLKSVRVIESDKLVIKEICYV